MSAQTFADEAWWALRAFEALVMPVTVFETDEFSAANAGDRLHASRATLGKEFTITIGAVWLLVFACESAQYY